MFGGRQGWHLFEAASTRSSSGEFALSRALQRPSFDSEQGTPLLLEDRSQPVGPPRSGDPFRIRKSCDKHQVIAIAQVPNAEHAAFHLAQAHAE